MKILKLSFRWLGVLMLASTLLVLGTTQRAFAAGVVGNGTPASCTEAALDSALMGQPTKLKFDCGAAVKTITLTTTKQMVYTTNINGGNKIILKAINVPHFKFSEPKVYTLKNITLTDGKATAGGAILNEAVLVLSKVKFENNKAGEAGGAIYNKGQLTVRKSTFSNNRAKQFAGAIFNDGGFMSILDSTFSGNSAADGGNLAYGGAVFSKAGEVMVRGGTFIENSAYVGGAFYKAAGTLSVEHTRFTSNKTVQIGTIYVSEEGGVFQDITVDHNTATSGAGLVTESGMIISHSTISNNTSTQVGGGIATMGGTLTLVASTVSGNTAIVGGGLFLGSEFEITNSTISGNRATQNGGGVLTFAGGSVANSTLSGNEAAANFKGGAWYQLDNNTTFTFVTVANNKAGTGGGIHVEAGVPVLELQNVLETLARHAGQEITGAVLTPRQSGMRIQNSLFAKNSGGNCNGTAYQIETWGNNLSDDVSCNPVFTSVTDRNNQNPKLGPLANNGGPTLTHLPSAGSKAIDGGFNLGLYQVDQRGYYRPYNGTSDIGAVEANSSSQMPQ